MLRRIWRWLRGREAPDKGRPAAARRIEPAAGDALFSFQWRNGRWLEHLLRDKYPLLRNLPESLAELAVRELRREVREAGGSRPPGDRRGRA